MGHMEERTGILCKQAVLEFVVDERDRVWFLWPLSVLVQEDGLDAQATLATASAATAATSTGSATGWMPPTLQLTTALAEEPPSLDGPLADFKALLGSAVGPEGAASRGHVLLVDDDAAAAVHAARVLIGASYTVTTTDDGPRGLALSRTNAFDCVLINRDLPTFSGLEVTRIIRQREAAMLQRKGVDVEALDPAEAADVRLPILAFTHRSEPDDLRLYREAGMNGCVTKPVLDDSLLSVIAAAIPAPTRSMRGRVVPPTPGGTVSPMGTWPRPASSGGLFPQSYDAPDASRSPALPPIQQPRMTAPPISPMVPVAEVSFEAPGAARSRSPPQSSTNAAYRNSPYAQPLALVTPQHTATPSGRPPAGASRTAIATAASRTASGDTVGVASSGRAARARSSIRPVTGGIHGGRMGDGAGLPAESGGAQSVSAVVGKQNAAKAATDASEADVVHGVFRLDVDTEMPYCAMGTDQPGTAFFHLVVVHDMFDTYERFQIFFRRMTRKMPGIRVLLFNYPGQAYTRFRKDVTLTNEYLAGCLHALLVHVGPAGNGCFSLDSGRAPFYLLGYGNGASIGTAFAVQYPDVYPHMRALVLINGYAYVDSQLAGALHDCVNVFSCTPPTRQDLPIYFYSRFLFSPAYLGKVGAALALNLYSAVANPITLDGRIALCNGALSHTNMSSALGKLDLPVICVTSTKDALVRADQSHAIAKARGGEVRSIRRALYSRRGAAIISLLAGHEVWLESKGAMLTLLYQLCTGYHERNDVAFLPLDDADLALLMDDDDKAALETSAVRLVTDPATMSLSRPMGAAARKELSGIAATRMAAPAPMLEDRFLDHVVATMRQPGIAERYAAPPSGSTRERNSAAPGVPAGISSRVDVLSREPVAPAAANEEAHSADKLRPTPAKILASLLPGIGVGVATIHTAPVAAVGGSPFATLPPYVDGKGRAVRKSTHPRDKAPLPPLKRLDNSEANKVTALLARRGVAGAAEASLRVGRSAIEKLAARSSSGPRSAAGVTGEHTPDLQEYMAWRIRRNQKRLHRLEAAATSMQRAFRAYLSRTGVRRVVETRSALDIQSWWRGEIARRYVAELRRVMSALKDVQRVYRGHRARIVVKRMRLQTRAAVSVQALFRGFLARRYVHQLKRFLNATATRIQTAYRRFAAIKELVHRRIQRVAAVSIQRIARGFLGRRIAARERDRFLFSKSQAQGIEFGRQLLMEHKLQATRLQSEVAILSRDKVSTEETIDGVMEEIATFEQGVRALERDMLQLAHADAEIASVIDEDARTELREQKLRLDREFARLLAKISDRKERLTALEGKLQTLDRTREAKHTELKELERKLVILLDQQQSELNAIRRRQDTRGERLVEDAVSAINESMGLPAIANPARGVLALEDASQSGALVPHRGGGGAHGSSSSSTLRFEDMPEVPGSGRMLAQRGAALPPGTATVSAQQRAEAAALMSSTETMMKFGFMSMSLTYFSALNMVRAMKQVGAANHMIATDPMLQMISTAGAAGMSGALPLAALPQLQSAAMPAATTAMANASQHRGALRPGQMPGQEAVDPELWTVGDVCAWLDALALGQYKDAFADAAIDGAFLMELSEDDLLNTLGVEHALHRKKIVGAIIKLQQRKQAAAAAAAQGLTAVSASPLRIGGSQERAVLSPSFGAEPTFIAPARLTAASAAGPMLSIDTALVQSTYQPSSPLRAAPSLPNSGYRAPAAAPGIVPGASFRGAPIAASSSLQEREMDMAEAAALAAARADAAGIRLEELLSWVRNNKGKQLADALAPLPDASFDISLVREPFSNGFGTVYVDRLNTPAFHINQAHEHGNTLMIVACQNGRMKMAQLLHRKGANVNHQNGNGNTAAHFAYTYKHWDLAAWLMDPAKGAADDSITNAVGNTPYDGLE